MNRFLLTSAVVAATLAMGGCVSSGKYEQLEADKNQVEKEKGTLQEQTAALEKEKSLLQEQIAALEKEKAALEANSQQRQSQYDALVKKLSAEVEQGQLQVRQYKNMLSVDVAEKIFFDSGRAELKESGKEVLAKVGEALKSYEDKVIRVVGYTDNVPIAKSMQRIYPTNWELSVARATNVVRFLQDAGVPPERMVAAGRGEFSPVAPNDTAEGRQKNRRIEIMLIDEKAAEELTTAQQ
ncbi:chemotaxis protein MotB [Sulfurifustis variabilis]|uniref:Chemotaxis protein MotB n=1 Tax=Sulfurifustis variabilis TaxID=1675686 RepID=A0A1B4V1U8_9GAMM|nr:OmpA family protein [Sulfurifustis variabilis]BAU47479.1 chemotaxis protein MotB [Sulfurifustis variabilis]